MERLTCPAQGYCEMYCKEYDKCFSDPETCIFSKEVQVYDKLRDYEQSQLEPLEVRILARADRDSRLVVLPCKIEDPIYLIHGQKETGKRIKYFVEQYDIDHFTIGGTKIPMITACSKDNEWAELIDGSQKGYEYFLTREEAESALATDKDVGHKGKPEEE